MQVSISKITPIYPSEVFLQWDIDPDAGVSGSYTFIVERSGSPEGPWTDISGLLTDAVFYSDMDYCTLPDVPPTDGSVKTEAINLHSLSREVYYRVKATDPVGTTGYSAPINLDGLTPPTVTEGTVGLGTLITTDEQRETTPYTGIATRPRTRQRIRLLRRKVLRDQYIQFKQLNGIDVKILKRRHFGQHCTACKDPFTYEIVIYKCTDCYGTGFIGGFFNPIGAFARFIPAAVQGDISDAGNVSILKTNVLTLSYPKIEKGDVVIEAYSNRRWLVESVYPTEMHRIVVNQRLTASELSRDSIEYLVPA
jgi:hypothetical protein